MTAFSSRNRLIGAVHAAAKAQGLDDDTYRDMLEAQAGKRSAKALSDAQLRKVLDHLNGAKSPSGRKPAESPAAKKARALWLSLYALGAVSDPSESALRTWVKRQYQVDDLAFVRGADSFAVIEGLKQWGARIGVDWTLHQDPRRCVLTAQWARLAQAGAAPASSLGDYARTAHGVPSVAFADGDRLDPVIRDLGERIRGMAAR